MPFPLPQQVLSRLAVGLIETRRQVVEGTANPITMPHPQLKVGLEQLCALCISQGVRPPSHHQEYVQWLHKPVEDWPVLGSTMPSGKLFGSLLFSGIPTDFAYDLAARVSGEDTETEIQDLPFKDVLNYCKAERREEEYTGARLFIVEHPYLIEGKQLIYDHMEWESTLCELLSSCYEFVPPAARILREGREWMALCPRCGWPLEWIGRHREYATCYSDLCSRLFPRLQIDCQWVPYRPGTLRTTPGIQKSIVAPERSLLALKQQLDEMGAKTILWCGVDNYDLWAELPNGRRLAIDLKDYSNPADLALALKAFKNYPEWDEAYYVIPDYRYNPQYMQRFQAVWKQRQNQDASLKKIQIKSVRHLVQHIKKKHS
ncbi:MULTISPECIES: hypothetical protein [Aerosakkonema]|uniref:restriction endonuclease-related protein n=1 Tax=Aerosakkonema TaxID=1246629 RepID=UPI0035BA3681